MSACVLALAWGCAGAPAKASDEVDARLPAPQLGASDVHAGQRVPIVWRSVPLQVEEFELVLSLDDGRVWSMRISPELEIGEDRYLWEIPNLAADRARIRIRARIGEREVWGPSGEPFRMSADSHRPRERWLFWEVARWDESDGDRGRVPGLVASAGAPILHAGSAPWALELPIRTLLWPTRQSRPSPPVTGSPPGPALLEPRTPSCDGSFPLRE